MPEKTGAFNMHSITCFLAFWHYSRNPNRQRCNVLYAINDRIVFSAAVADRQREQTFLSRSSFCGIDDHNQIKRIDLGWSFGCVCLLLLGRKVRTAASSGQLNTCTERSSPITHTLHLYLNKPQTYEFVRKTLFFIIIITFALYISLFRGIGIAIHDHHYNILDPNASGEPSALAVNNSLCNLFCLDLNTYVSQPFTDPWHDKGGRQYLWNYFFKSMLFGEFSFSFTSAQFLAKVLSVLLLQIVAFSFIGIVSSIRKLNVPNLIMLLWLFLLLLFLLYFRYTNPFAPNQDLKYIFPVIIPFIYFYITGIESFTKCKFMIIGSFGYIITYLFVIASFCFFIVPLGT